MFVLLSVRFSFVEFAIFLIFTWQNRRNNRRDRRTLAKQSACIALYYRNTWNVVERTAYI